MINDNNVRRPRMQSAETESTRVATPELDLEEPKELSPEEIVLDAANEGRLDLGEEGEELTPEQIMNRASVRQAAQIIPQMVQDSKDRYVQDLKEDMPWTRRASTAANNFMLGLTDYVPGALKTKTLLHNGIVDWAWKTGEGLAGVPEGERQGIPVKGTPQDLPEIVMGRTYHQLGEEIGQELKEIFPTSPLYRDEFWAGTMAKAAGNFIPQVAAGVGTAGVGTLGAMVTQTALSSGMIFSSSYEEAIAGGATEEDAFEVALLNMGGTAGLEAIPMALFAKRLDKATKGSFKQVLKNGFKGSLEEGTTEAIQQYFSNVVARGYYDETRDLMLGVGESFAAGAILGGVANASFTALMREEYKADSIEAELEARDGLDFLVEFYGEELGYTKKEIAEHMQSRERSEGKDKVVQETTQTEQGIAEPGTRPTYARRGTWERFKNKYFEWFPVDEKAGKIQQEEEAWISGEIKTAELGMIRLNRAILDHFGAKDKKILPKLRKQKSIAQAIKDGDVPAEIALDIDAAMRDPDALAQLPQSLQEPVNSLRKHIDRLSEEFVKRGYVQGETAVKFLADRGTYIHRSYKIFDPEVEWNEKNIPRDDWNAAINVISSKLFNEALRENPTKAPSDAKVKRLAERKLRELLSADKDHVGSMAYEITRNKEKLQLENKGDIDVLLQRQDIHPAIRKVMGEVSDAAINYINTIEKMANTIGKRSMFNRIADEFKGVLFFTKDQTLDFENYHEMRYKLNTGVKSKLDNLYMHEDVYKAFHEENDTGSAFPGLTTLYRVNLASKYAKTVLSHVTIARNVTGGMGFMAFNGLFFNIRALNPMYQSAKSAFQGLERLDKTENAAERKIYLARLGLEGKSIRFGELQDVKHDAKLEQEDPYEAQFRFLEKLAVRNKEVGYAQKALNKVIDAAGVFKKGSSKFIDKAGQFYKRGDDFVRIWTFELEKARYQAADPSITDQQVADIVLDTYQNYDRVAPLAKEVRKIPAIGPFISFPLEVVRTAINSGRQARKDIDSENPKIRKIGYERIAGMIGTTATIMGLGVASQLANRIDDDEDQAFRRFMPEWDAQSVLAYTKVGRGVVKYLNTSYTNPHAYLLDPVIATIKGEDDDTIIDRTVSGFKKLMEPIWNEEIAWKAISEATINRTRQGGEIYNPQDTSGDKVQKVLTHLWKAVEPGSITSAKRTVEKLNDDDSNTAATEELLGLFGFRMITVDVAKSFGFDIREQRQAIRDARRVYNAVKFDENATASDEKEALRNANESYRRAFENMKESVEAAQKTGVSWYELEEIMEESGLANRDINGLARGVFTPFEP